MEGVVVEISKQDQEYGHGYCDIQLKCTTREGKIMSEHVYAECDDFLAKAGLTTLNNQEFRQKIYYHYAAQINMACSSERDIARDFHSSLMTAVEKEDEALFNILRVRIVDKPLKCEARKSSGRYYMTKLLDSQSFSCLPEIQSIFGTKAFITSSDQDRIDRTMQDHYSKPNQTHSLFGQPLTEKEREETKNAFS